MQGQKQKTYASEFQECDKPLPLLKSAKRCSYIFKNHNVEYLY